MGRIYKRKNSLYWFYDLVDPDGRRKRISTGVKDKKTAELILAKVEVEVAEGTYFDKREKISPVMFEEMADKYFEWSKANKRSWIKEKFSIKKWKDYFPGKKLTEISSFLIEGYKIKRKAEVAPRTVNIELACLKHLFTKAIEWGFAKENPVKKVKFFRVNNARLRYLSEDEIQRLLNACDEHLKPIVLTALHTGMRKSEILNLKWVDVDLHNGIIHIPDSKSGERRDVPMSDILLGTLIELKKKAKLDCVFTTSKGKVRPIKDIRTIFSNALKKSGITNFRFHDLRHTFASYLVMNGVDLRTVQELLGHKDFSMTLRYSHLSPAHKKDAVKVMDRITEKCIWHTFGTLSNSVKIVK